MHKVLNEKDPGLFSTSPFLVRQSSNEVHLIPLDKTYNFREMEALRVPQKIDELPEVEVANVGVSANLVVMYQEKQYLALAVQHHPDIELPYAKLISGFVETPHLKTPRLAIEKELQEEILIYDQNKELINADYQLQNANGHRKVFIDEIALEGSPEIRMINRTNSAQLIYHYTLNLDALAKPVSSVFHAEEMFNPIKKVVETLLYEHGLVLLRVEDQTLPQYAFNLHDGVLKAFDLKSVKVSPYIQSLFLVV